jgi:hypothetical protein
VGCGKRADATRGCAAIDEFKRQAPLKAVLIAHRNFGVAGRLLLLFVTAGATSLQ